MVCSAASLQDFFGGCVSAWWGGAGACPSLTALAAGLGRLPQCRHLELKLGGGCEMPEPQVQSI